MSTKINPELAGLGTVRGERAQRGGILPTWSFSICAISGCLRATITLALAAIILPGLLSAQSAGSGKMEFNTGKEVFERGCITCHGPDGRGTPKSTLGFEPPSTFPDFTNCNGTTREPNHDWKAIITHGGPARGFSEIMPSFLEALTSGQIDMVIEYLRGFCKESSWPRGEMNLPRALMTEKAFPEDEAVITAAINAEGTPGTDFKIVYERRFGARNQIEVSIPFSFARQETNSWHGGVGDIGLGYRRLLLVSNLRSGSILSVQGEAILPTGNRDRGFGTGVLFFETFVSYGQILPKGSFLQFQSGLELPTRPEEANKAAYWRINFGKRLYQGLGFGRMWTPMIELLADRELATNAGTNWDLLPQFQVTLSRRQHIRANIGIKFPVNNAGPRSAQVLFYLLWDWFDGGLRDGWK
jgi:mono/diheme cytochrome c family protein